MLYPIELLRHTLCRSRRCMTDGVHVNHRTLICHVVRLAFKCRQAACNAAGRFTVHFARPQKSHCCRLQSAQFEKPAQMLVFKGLNRG